MPAVKKLQITNYSPTLIIGEGGVTAVKILQLTNCSPTAVTSSPLAKQSCTAEAKLHNPEISVPPNFRVNHGFATNVWTK